MRAELEARRRRLSNLLPDTLILLHAGVEQFRNIRAVAYPFRTSSHCLFLCGRMPPESLLLLLEGEVEVFLPEWTPEDIVWQGSMPDYSILKNERGIRAVWKKSELRSRLKEFRGKPVLSLPHVHPEAQRELERTLGRALTLDGPDQRLAEAMVEVRLTADSLTEREVRGAVALNTKAHQRAREAIAPGVPESAVVAELESVVRTHDCSPCFPAIVTQHGEILHNVEHGARLESGQLVLIDFGSESPEGYASDMTRTWPVEPENVTSEQKDIYQIVLKAQTEVLKQAAPGVEFQELHLNAAVHITEGLCSLGLLRGDPYALVERGAHVLFFPHGLGHLLGLDVHDMGDLGDIAGYAPGRKRSEEFGFSFLRLDRPLTPGMVLTIEPGWYWIPALLEDEERTAPFRDVLSTSAAERFRHVRGVRVEDTVLVTEKGCEVLSRELEKDWN